jgi:ornithine cyclodeaminase
VENLLSKNDQILRPATIYSGGRIIGKLSKSNKESVFHIKTNLRIPVVELKNVIDAINKSDLIFLCTNTVKPIIKKAFKEGTTIISIGSFSPNREEIAGNVVASANLIFGDDSQTIQTQCGSVVAALKINPALKNRITSLGTLLNNPALGRTSANQVIIYFSVGLGIQDAAIVEKFLELEKK